MYILPAQAYSYYLYYNITTGEIYRTKVLQYNTQQTKHNQPTHKTLHYPLFFIGYQPI